MPQLSWRSCPTPCPMQIQPLLYFPSYIFPPRPIQIQFGLPLRLSAYPLHSLQSPGKYLGVFVDIELRWEQTALSVSEQEYNQRYVEKKKRRRQLASACGLAHPPFLGLNRHLRSLASESQNIFFPHVKIYGQTALRKQIFRKHWRRGNGSGQIWFLFKDM